MKNLQKNKTSKIIFFGLENYPIIILISLGFLFIFYLLLF